MSDIWEIYLDYQQAWFGTEDGQVEYDTHVIPLKLKLGGMLIDLLTLLEEDGGEQAFIQKICAEVRISPKNIHLP